MESAYGTIAVRDVKKFGDLLDNHLRDLETNLGDAHATLDTHQKSEIKHGFEQAHDTIAKMKKYLVDIIKKS